MITITTATHQSERQMRDALAEGLHYALHLENFNKQHGKAIFALTREALEGVLHKESPDWDTWQICHYPGGQLNNETTLQRR